MPRNVSHSPIYGRLRIGRKRSLNQKSKHERRVKIQELPLATSETLSAAFNSSHDSSNNHYLNLPKIWQLVQRTALMGKHQRMRDDLVNIRKWHLEHGFKGGLVLRDLTKPAFGMDLVADGQVSDNIDNLNDNDDWTLQEIIDDPTRLARRECYYMYYEIREDGQVIQQIFCRGTTLKADILTCLEAWMVYDEDLGCRLHRGFRNQADRILHDVLPLLSPQSNRRSTVELCGHSLGGAVAMILAAKLRKRGYRNVVSVLTIGEPRFCWSDKDASILAAQLPKNTLRMEGDLDFVTFLPPFGSHPMVNKLWLASCDGGAVEGEALQSLRIVNVHTHSWTDRVWMNLQIWKLLQLRGKPHRLPYYVEALQREN
ncbi:hypothetical protein MPSEU_000035700 [Mayamaea pseudoterrestris]|nr:hypothetical protein MPSEU_000035700 [Mayamaea pseudoterrestris]